MAQTKHFDTTIEGFEPGVKIVGGLNCNLPVYFNNTLEVNGAFTADSTITTSATGTFGSPLVVGTAQVIVGVLNQVAGPTGVSAPTGSIFLSYSGGTGPATRAFINNNGATGWVAITTAS